MNIEPLKKRRDWISIALLVLSALFCLLIAIKVSGFYTASARAESLIEQAKVQGENDPNIVKEYFDERKKEAEELVKKNLFAPPPPKKHPVQQVTGILGDTALINGKWHKVGDKIGDANVLEITPTYVKIEWEGKEKTYSPFDVEIKEEKKEQKSDKQEKKEEKKEQKKEKKTEVKEVSATSQEDPLAWMGVELSPALREKMLEHWNGLSQEQKEQAKEEWNRMSDEERQEALKQMEEHM